MNWRSKLLSSSKTRLKLLVWFSQMQHLHNCMYHSVLNLLVCLFVFFPFRKKKCLCVFVGWDNIHRMTEEATNGNSWPPDTRTFGVISRAAFEIDDYWRIVDILHKRFNSSQVPLLIFLYLVIKLIIHRWNSLSCVFLFILEKNKIKKQYTGGSGWWTLIGKTGEGLTRL